MRRTAIRSSQAPAALGAYSHAVAAGEWVFTSGQLPIDPTTGQLVGGDLRDQVRQAMRNVQAVLRSAGLDLADVVKVTVFLADVSQARAMNEAYSEFFPADPPARTTVGAALPGGASVEIEAVAVRPS